MFTSFYQDKEICKNLKISFLIIYQIKSLFSFTIDFKTTNFDYSLNLSLKLSKVISIDNFATGDHGADTKTPVVYRTNQALF